MIRILLLLLLAGCSWAPRSTDYRAQYSYLKRVPRTPSVQEEIPFSLTILVNARHLDYSDGQSLLRTMVKHPSDGSLNGDVGHAWILLQGEGAVLEGGHSGEWGIQEPKYFDGIMDLVEQGDRNPVRYLGKTLQDGCFQTGTGGHDPTYAARIPLTKEEYLRLRAQILNTDFAPYSMTDRQCVTFIESLLQDLGICLETKVAIPIPYRVKVGRETFVVRTDPEYAEIVFHSPDLLEKELMALVSSGRAEYALPYYLERYPPECTPLPWEELPFRASRVWLIR